MYISRSACPCVENYGYVLDASSWKGKKAAVNTYAAFERLALEERLARNACPAAVSAAAVGGVLAG